MSARSKAIEVGLNWFESAFETELAKLVAIPSESQDPRGAPHLERYLREGIAPMLNALGFECEIFDNPSGHPCPLMIAERIEDPALITMLSYGHGDVVRAQEGRWAEARDPFVLSRAGERLYGRGTADNKCQHLINIQALAAVLAVRGSLGFNVKILIEMAEENGSPGLKAFCEQQSERLAADVFIASDGPRLAPDVATLFTGSRGAVNFDLVVDLREGAHHSGNFGGLLADPTIILSHAIASITDARGQIKVPEWRPTSLSQKVRDLIAHVPAPKAGFALDPDWGEAELSQSERVFGWNSFAVLAMESGVPAAPLNAIAGSARATCQLRFVVGTDEADIVPALRRHLSKAGFDKVQVKAWETGLFPATRLDPENPWLSFAAKSLEETSGTRPHVLPNLGGSLPNDCFSEVLNLPTIWVPHSYAGCNQHAPDEHILWPVARSAMECMTGLFMDLGEEGARP